MSPSEKIVFTLPSVMTSQILLHSLLNALRIRQFAADMTGKDFSWAMFWAHIIVNSYSNFQLSWNLIYCSVLKSLHAIYSSLV